jgi:hypothetical protein
VPVKRHGFNRGVVDIPNACATLWLPTDIFEFDVKPGNSGPFKALDGSIDVPLAPDLGTRWEGGAVMSLYNYRCSCHR